MNVSAIIQAWKSKTRALKIQTYALYYATRDPRLPWYTRVVTLLVVAYAFSPIDLIPDFIPVLGYLDDLVIVPLGIWLALRLVPGPVMAESRAKAEQAAGEDKPVFRIMGAVILLVWAAVIVWAGVRLLGGLKR